MPVPAVRVDFRERACPIPTELERLGLPIVIENLAVGDYIIGDVAVERKKDTDFLASMTSGHLNNQLYELSKNFDLSYLAITGNLSQAVMGSGIPRNAYISKLIGSSIKYAADGKQGRIITIQFLNDLDLALAIKYLHEKITNPEFRLPELPKFQPTADTWMMFIMKSFPNVAEVRATALLKHFGSIHGFANATVEDMTKIKGINKKTAEQLYNLVHEEFKGDEI